MHFSRLGRSKQIHIKVIEIIEISKPKCNIDLQIPLLSQIIVKHIPVNKNTIYETNQTTNFEKNNSDI